MVIECEGAGLRWLREWTSQFGKRSAAISQVGGLSGTAEPHPERGVCCSNRRNDDELASNGRLGSSGPGAQSDAWLGP